MPVMGPVAAPSTALSVVTTGVLTPAKSIVSVAVDRPSVRAEPSVGLLSASETVASPSAWSVSRISTVNVWLVTPGAKVNVPLVAV